MRVQGKARRNRFLACVLGKLPVPRVHVGTHTRPMSLKMQRRFVVSLNGLYVCQKQNLFFQAHLHTHLCRRDFVSASQ